LFSVDFVSSEATSKLVISAPHSASHADTEKKRVIFSDFFPEKIIVFLGLLTTGADYIITARRITGLSDKRCSCENQRKIITRFQSV